MQRNTVLTSTKRWGVALAGVALLGGVCVWSLGGFGTRISKTQAQESPPAEKPAKMADKKILYWKSPMDPTYISPTPGKEPVMGMDLVPVYEGEEEVQEGGVVKIDPVTIQNIGVKTEVVERRSLSRVIRTVGRIDYDETKVRQITLKVGGWIEKQHVDFTGQVVRKGERLLEIYSPDLVSTQEEYLRALQFREALKGSSFGEVRTGAEDLVESARIRLLFWDITPRQIRALEETRQITKTMTLHAPFRGVITKKEVLEGAYVKSGQPLYTIADLTDVWVYADIYEYEAPWIGPGQEAEMTLAYLPGRTYKGKVIYIYPYLKNMTRTLQVRLAFANSRSFDLKPDMWADVIIHSPITRNGLAVPIDAVLRTGKRNIALVALGGGKFAPRELKLGPEADGSFEVLSGLKEGERIVTSAQFLINSESSLRSAIQKMLETRLGDSSVPSSWSAGEHATGGITKNKSTSGTVQVVPEASNSGAHSHPKGENDDRENH